MAVEKHKHCIICGKSIPVDEFICSEKCKEKYIARQKKVALTQKIYFGVFIILILVFIYLKFIAK